MTLKEMYCELGIYSCSQRGLVPMMDRSWMYNWVVVAVAVAVFDFGVARDEP